MKLKFNWGTGILIFFMIFFTCIFWLIFFTYNTQEDLVEKDYYLKELNYKDQIEKQINLIQLGEKIIAKKNKEWIHIQFPKSQIHNQIKGEIKVYCPSNIALDQSYQIALDSFNQYKIKISLFKEVKYILKIDWIYQNKPFYDELMIKL